METQKMNITTTPLVPSQDKSYFNVFYERIIKDENYILLDLLDKTSFCIGDFVAKTSEDKVFLGSLFLNHSIDEQYFILNHELLHIIYNHNQLMKSDKFKNKIIFNIAADIIVNERLQNLGLIAVEGMCLRSNFNNLKGQTSSDIYFELLGNDGEGDNCGDDKLLEMLPYNHTQKNDKLMMEILKNSRLEVKNVLQFDSGLELNKGEVTISEDKSIASFKELLLEKVEATIPEWEKIIKSNVGKLLEYTYEGTYSRPSRKFISTGITMSYKSTQYIPKIIIIVDTSGSMRDLPKVIFSKLKALESHFRKYLCKYYAFSDTVYPFDFMHPYYQHGGTNIHLAFNLIKEMNADLSLVITDMKFEYELSEVRNKTLIITNSDISKYQGQYPYVKFFYSELGE
jgi:predicted metal-dependent peptidase